ncbi:ISAs1 family transposase [Frankia umida]|uniref:ISAs1 family transposase n=1 Tax=Frankia umida TaxID=573489 RepID=UPI0020102DA0|nr:ISAs1 family transposase [Frankia umida]
MPPADLFAVFELVADPRKRRGRRHRLPVLLTLATCAVPAGARLFAAIAEWAADAKTNEIPLVKDLLAGLDLTDTVVTADAPHTQDDTAAWLLERDAHYLMVVKANRPTLHAQLAALPWTKVHTTSRTTSRGHGRAERRTVKATEIRTGTDFPHAVQAVRITRRRRSLTNGKVTSETIHAVTSLPSHQASPALLAELAQGHWAIENQLHWVRDVTYDEDHHRARTGNAPQVMASLRNLAITILHLTGTNTIAQALRHHARRPERPLQTIKRVGC